MSAVASKRDDQFPTHFNNGRLEVFSNPSGEIFVVDLATKSQMRISAHPRGGLQFTTPELVEPERVTNMIGWSVKKRT
jgi:hypothetical protein